MQLIFIEALIRKRLILSCIIIILAVLITIGWLKKKKAFSDGVMGKDLMGLIAWWILSAYLILFHIVTALKDMPIVYTERYMVEEMIAIKDSYNKRHRNTLQVKGKNGDNVIYVVAGDYDVQAEDKVRVTYLPNTRLGVVERIMD